MSVRLSLYIARLFLVGLLMVPIVTWGWAIDCFGLLSLGGLVGWSLAILIGTWSLALVLFVVGVFLPWGP